MKLSSVATSGLAAMGNWQSSPVEDTAVVKNSDAIYVPAEPHLESTAVMGKDAGGAVYGMVSPHGEAPSGCSSTYDQKFEATIYALKDGEPQIQKRSSCDNDHTLVMTLSNGVLKDAHDRVGYIASNFQFQFDNPPQSGALYTSGFSMCSNNSLALGSSTVFTRCLSGHFYNLYDRDWAHQCDLVSMVAVPCGGGDDVQEPQGAPEAPPAICQIGDGQVQFHTTPCVATKTPEPRPVSPASVTEPAVPQTVDEKPAASVTPSVESTQQVQSTQQVPSVVSPSVRQPSSSSSVVQSQPSVESQAPRVYSSAPVPSLSRTPQTAQTPTPPLTTVTGASVKMTSNATAAFFAALLALAYSLHY